MSEQTLREILKGMSKDQLEEYLDEIKQEAANSPKYDLTELGNAKRFTDKFKGELMFVHENQEWFFWDQRLWKSDNNGQALRQFELLIEDLKQERAELVKALKDAGDSPRAKEIKAQANETSKWLKSCQKAVVMRNSLFLAAAQDGMSVALSEFDRKGHFFGCANGIIDLRDGSLITGDKRYLMTKSAPVAYNKDAKCPEWDSFLLKIMNGNVENVLFLQRLVGQAMLGTQGKDKLAILWGTGANGKSTFVDTLNDIMGQYATVTDPRMLMDNNRSNKEYYMAPLKGVRLCLMSETKRGDMIAEAIVKMLVDGGEITARYPAGRVFTFQPVFTPILSTNHRPKVGADPAIWRRVLLVPFTYTIPAEERNPQFRTQVLKPEAEGILKWCVDGAQMYLKDGLAPTGDVVDATEEYKRSQDKLGMFITQECATGESLRMRLKDFQDQYNAWCLDQGLQTIGVITLKEELASRGLEVRQSTGHVNWLYGVAPKPDDYDAMPQIKRPRAGGLLE
jgi:putative DNA primase/helicase